jgi:hypothetical protein
MMPNQLTNAYAEFYDNQNCVFEVSSKSLKYHTTNFGLHLVKVIAAVAQFLSYILLLGWSFDIETWCDKNVYHPIDEKLANNKKLEMIRLGINKIAIPMKVIQS